MRLSGRCRRDRVARRMRPGPGRLCWPPTPAQLSPNEHLRLLNEAPWGSPSCPPSGSFQLRAIQACLPTSWPDRKAPRNISCPAAAGSGVRDPSDLMLPNRDIGAGMDCGSCRCWGNFACWCFRARNWRVLFNWALSLHATSWQFSAQGRCRRHWVVPAAFCPDGIHAAEEQMLLALSTG